MANYKFSIGDYVETKSGAKGYIDEVLSGDFYYFNWVVTETDGDRFKDYCRVPAQDLSKFTRIGKYDFSNNKMIEKLTTNYTKINFENVVAKINELVEVVNKFLDK